MKDILDVLPELISYFVPGYIGLSVFYAFTRRKRDSAFMIPLSFIISYIILFLIKYLNNTYSEFFFSVSVGEMFLALIISLLISILGIKIYTSSTFREFMFENFRFSFSNDVWESLYPYDNDKYVSVIVKIRDEQYSIKGQLAAFDDSAEHKWIALHDYKYVKDGTTDAVDWGISERNKEHFDPEHIVETDYIIINTDDILYTSYRISKK